MFFQDILDMKWSMDLRFVSGMMLGVGPAIEGSFSEVI
jgi:hypothetical protein